MGAILNTFLFGNTFSALELFSEAGAIRISFIKVKKAGNGLKIDTLQFFDGTDQLEPSDTKEPVVLIVNTDQVLIKEVEVQEVNEKKILYKAFPNVKADEFYYEIWTHKQHAIVAITRKEYINKLIATYKGLRLSGIFLGLGAISNFTDFELPQELVTNTHVINLNGDPIIVNKEIENSRSYSINGINVDSHYLNAFGGVLRLFMPKRTLGNLNELDVSINENFKQESFFRKGLATGVVTILILLLINFVFFNYYYDRVQQEQATTQLKITENTVINRLQKQIKEKEAQLKSFEYNSNRPFAGIINSIAKDVPQSVLLEEVTLNPLLKKIKEREPVTLEDNRIIIKGNTLNTVAFTGWIKRIQGYPMVTQTKIISFGGGEGNGNEFSILIQLKDEAQQKK